MRLPLIYHFRHSMAWKRIQVVRFLTPPTNFRLYSFAVPLDPLEYLSWGWDPVVHTSLQPTDNLMTAAAVVYGEEGTHNCFGPGWVVIWWHTQVAKLQLSPAHKRVIQPCVQHLDGPLHNTCTRELQDPGQYYSQQHACCVQVSPCNMSMTICQHTANNRRATSVDAPALIMHYLHAPAFGVDTCQPWRCTSMLCKGSKWRPTTKLMTLMTSSLVGEPVLPTSGLVSCSARKVTIRLCMDSTCVSKYFLLLLSHDFTGSRTYMSRRQQVIILPANPMCLGRNLLLLSDITATTL